MMHALLTFWRTIVDLVAIICLVIVLYDHREKVQRGLAWIGDRMRRKS